MRIVLIGQAAFGESVLKRLHGGRQGSGGRLHASQIGEVARTR